MGTHLSTNHQGRPILHNRQDGCPQVCRGASEEEAVGCHAVPPPCPLLGTPSIERHPPRQPPLAPRQGPPSRLQGQAGLRYLPRPRPSRWTQAPRPQGPRGPRPHRHRQEEPWSQQGPQVQQHQGWPQKDLEAPEHPVPVALPISGSPHLVRTSGLLSLLLLVRARSLGTRLRWKDSVRCVRGWTTDLLPGPLQRCFSASLGGGWVSWIRLG